MTKVLEAIYEGGVLRPLGDLGLAEHQRVLVEIRLPAESAPELALAEWHRVYEGLSDAEITEVESVALGRSRFFHEP